MRSIPPDKRDPYAETNLLLRAMLALQVADRDSRLSGTPARRTEIVLVEAGMTIADAASFAGKQYEAVKKAVQRAKTARPAARAPEGAADGSD